ncbi:MAG: hypothetical protein AAGG81_00550, partial [Chlamydiota bacterium]
ICQGSRTDNTNSIDSGQNGSTKKLIGKGRAQARAEAEARDCSFERGLMKISDYIDVKTAALL